MLLALVCGFFAGGAAVLAARACFDEGRAAHHRALASAACREAAPEDTYRCVGEWYGSRGLESPTHALVLRRVREAMVAPAKQALR